MKCPHCGKEIANDSVFCEYCGEKIKNLPSSQPVQFAPTKKSKFQMLAWIVGVGAVAVLLIIGVITYVVLSSSSNVPSAQDDVTQPADAEDEEVREGDVIPWEKQLSDDLKKPGYIRDSNPPTNVREAQSRYSPVINHLNNGDFIYYIPNESGWYEVYRGDVYLGYVHRTLICPAK
jgi:hypothetical protein